MITEEKIYQRLVGDLGYPTTAATNEAAEALFKMYGDVAEAFESWWHNGKIPDIEVEGYSFQYLINEYGLKIPAAFLTIFWLVRDPETARAALISGYDRIVL